MQSSNLFSKKAVLSKRRKILNTGINVCLTDNIISFDGWVDGLPFYFLLNSISAIRGGGRVMMKGFVQWNSLH